MRRATRVVLLLLAAALPGCRATPERVRWFLLEPQGEAAAPAVDAPAVNVGPVVLAAGLDRPQIVRRLGDNEVGFEDDARWGEPLASGIARVLAEDLARVLGTERVGLVPELESPEEGWRVVLHVLRFEVHDDEAVAEVRWRLVPAGERTPEVTRRLIATSPIRGAGLESAVLSLSLCLQAVADDIAEALPR